MSIRMKEWGMMSQPGRGVRVPTDGLTGWGEAARRVGEGLSAALSGAADVLQERARVKAAGELADFSERLHSIERETREELAEQDVQDWGYAWKSAMEPKLAEAVEELSPDSRAAGRRLAGEFSARASLEARRDYELSRIDTARTRWRNRVDQAVQAGDARGADEWLDAGQGLFVAPEQMPGEQEAARSRAYLNRWQNELQARPLEALSRLSSAPQEELPTRAADHERLAHARSQAGQAARREVLQHLLACMEDEVSPQAEVLTMAAEAGVITRRQSETAGRGETRLTHETRREWLRRIDESGDDAQAGETLQLEIATAGLPAAESRELLARVEMSRSLPAQERRSLSRNLWELYRSGALGCPGDAEAGLRFAALQQESLARLQQQGHAGATDWVRGMRDLSDRWVCFTPQETA